MTVVFPAIWLIFGVLGLVWTLVHIARGTEPDPPTPAGRICGSVATILLLVLGGILDRLGHPGAVLALLFFVGAGLMGFGSETPRRNLATIFVGTVVSEFLLFWGGFYDDLLKAVGTSL